MDYKQLDLIKIINSDIENLRVLIEQFLDTSQKSIHIITFNLDFYYTAEHSEIFRRICRNADIVVPDGYGITFLLRLKYKQKIKRITGNELFALLLGLSNIRKLNVAFVGSTRNVMDRLTSLVKSEYPGIKITASITPPVYFEKDERLNKQVLDELTAASPDILFIALGSPRQELWLNKYRDVIKPKVCIGVGAAFDFYAGYKKRSPVFLQSVGLEWLWRLINEPTRLFRRYILNDLPFFIGQAIKILLKHE